MARVDQLGGGDAELQHVVETTEAVGFEPVEEPAHDAGTNPPIIALTPRPLRSLPSRERPLHRAAKKVAPPGGLEPPTHGLEGRCSIHLSYGSPSAH